MTIGKHEWCVECGAPSVVADDSVECTHTFNGEDYYRVVTLDCGHDIQIPSTYEAAVLPYAGTSGWSGTDTSEERAASADRSGKTSKRQADAISAVRWRGSKGMTVAEFREASGWHHGTSSGVLSVLHKTGKLAMLTEKRNKCHVYVHPDWVDGRETRSHGRANMVTITQEEYDRLVGRY